MSTGQPKEQSVSLVTIDKTWLDGWDKMNLTLFWEAYSTGTDHSTSIQHVSYNVSIIPKPVDHLPPNIHSGKPSKESLIIALPIVLGFVLLVVLGLLFGLRSQRRIGLGNIMGRRRGYGTNKSRRQRLGIKKGAIRLEEREIVDDPMPPRSEFRDRDEIRSAPRRNDQSWSIPPPQTQQNTHARDLSLGSLLTDGSARNSYRPDGRL